MPFPARNSKLLHLSGLITSFSPPVPTTHQHALPALHPLSAGNKFNPWGDYMYTAKTNQRQVPRGRCSSGNAQGRQTAHNTPVAIHTSQASLAILPLQTLVPFTVATPCMSSSSHTFVLPGLLRYFFQLTSQVLLNIPIKGISTGRSLLDAASC